jgi:chorismate synthase
LCIAGGICLQLLEAEGIRIAAHILSVGAAKDRGFDPMGEEAEVLDALQNTPLAVLEPAAAEAVSAEILAAKAEADSVGGVIECIVQGLPAGLGDPMFSGLENRIAQAVFAIPAVKGLEFGAGFAAAEMRGSGHNDAFCMENGAVKTKTNRHGGILGGISTGMPLLFRAAFKPTPSIGKQQETVSLSAGTDTLLTVQGRHDPCIVPRAVPCVEAAAALAVYDALLRDRAER